MPPDSTKAHLALTPPSSKPPDTPKNLPNPTPLRNPNPPTPQP